MKYRSYKEAIEKRARTDGLMQYVVQQMAAFNDGQEIDLDFLSRADVGAFCQALGFDADRNWGKLTLDQIAPPDKLGPNVVPEKESALVLHALKVAIQKEWLQPSMDKQPQTDILNDFLPAPGRFQKKKTLGHGWEFQYALAVELEHGRTRGANVSNNHPLLTGMVVMAHLAEDRLYYARLWVMESEGELFNLQLEKAKPKQIFEKLEELGHARQHLQKRIAEKLAAARA